MLVAFGCEHVKLLIVIEYELVSGSWGTSVSIVSDYGLDDRVIGVQSPAEVADFFL
jgi:hypothetical protein